MGRRTIVALLGLSLAAALAAPAHADIYQFTDEQGVIHFSNVSVGNSKNYKRVKSTPAREQTKEQTKVQQVAYVPRGAASSPAPVSSRNVPSAYVDMIKSACDRHGIDPALVHAIVKVESDFNPYALSRKGAMGLMQLMPQTALNMNVKNSFNPNENIDGGVKYLRYLIDRYEGNLQLALAAYNSGETAVRKWGTVPPFRETQNYVERILNIYQGGGKGFTPRYTIYMGYGEDGAILLTDDPHKHKDKTLKRKIQKNL